MRSLLSGAVSTAQKKGPAHGGASLQSDKQTFDLDFDERCAEQAGLPTPHLSPVFLTGVRRGRV